VSGSWLNTQSLSPYPPLQSPPPLYYANYSCWGTLQGFQVAQCCRASRKLLVDSWWGNQGKYRHSKSQENSKAGPNTRRASSDSKDHDGLIEEVIPAPNLQPPPPSSQQLST
jgi:hypothetical protein